MDKIRQHEKILVLGDFNGKVAKEATVRTVAGKYSLHEESNNNGPLLA